MSELMKEKEVGRRSFLRSVPLLAAVGALAAQSFAALRALVPNVLYEKPRRAKLGPPEAFADGISYLEDQNIFLVKEGSTFQAISAVCTHLGCTVKLLRFNPPKMVDRDGKPAEERQEFHCPCHGSRYHGDGVNFAGPAPRPLDRFQVMLAPEDGQLVVDLERKVALADRFTI